MADAHPVRSALIVQEPLPAPRESWYAVAVLTLVSIFGFIDRQILSLLVAPIRRDLGISDTQMSLLLGFSFVALFALFAIPLGRLADRWSRRAVLAGGFAAWSLCTAGCGLARSFGQMLVLRMGVGMGEATLNPCAFSIISDSFPVERRATALSVFSMGMSIGSGLAFLAGGIVIRFASQQAAWNLPLVGAVRPWQLILLEVGLAGLLVAGLLFTIREPARRNPTAVSTGAEEALAYIKRNRTTFFCHHAGMAMFAVAATSGGAWIPEMFRRLFHWSIPRFGVYFGIEVAVFGCLGVVAAGRLADRMSRRGVGDANMRVVAWIAFAALPVNMLLFLAPSGGWAMLWLAFGTAIMAAPYGVAAAALHQVLPVPIRSQATAFYLVVLNLVGATTGPTLTALITEHVFRSENALNYSMLIVHVFALSASAFLLRKGRRPFLETVNRLSYARPDAARG